MAADFLPLSVTNIQDPEAIALLKQLQRRVIQVPFYQGTVLVSTAYIHQFPDSSSQFPQTPILLLHGFDSSVLEFRRLLPRLAVERDTWALDLFGFGFTEYCSQVAVNPETVRRHLYSFLSTCICQGVILVGASLGGAVAIDFALHHPDWVKALVLIDSVGFSGSFPLGQFLPSPVIEWGADWLHFRKLAALTAVSSIPINNPTLIDALRCSLLHHEMPGWKAAIASFAESGGYNIGTQISQVRHPTLILWGEADDVLGTDDADKFERAISASKLVWIEQASHLPHFDRPESVAAHILSFVQ